jgi:hypothetical protein
MSGVHYARTVRDGSGGSGGVHYERTVRDSDGGAGNVRSTSAPPSPVMPVKVGQHAIQVNGI